MKWDEKAVVKMVLKISPFSPIMEQPHISVQPISHGKWLGIKAQQGESRLSSWLMRHPRLHGRLIRTKSRSNGLIDLEMHMLRAWAIIKEQIHLPLKATKSFLLKGKNLEKAQRKSFSNSLLWEQISSPICQFCSFLIKETEPTSPLRLKKKYLVWRNDISK